MTDLPKENQIYRHFKGDLYRIVALAKHAETEETMVVYQALYGGDTVYVTELSRFRGRADDPAAEQKRRFALVTHAQGQREEEVKEKGKEEASRPHEHEASESHLDPLLLMFLDAETYKEKLSVLRELRDRITDDMINTMAVSLDVEVNEGKTEDRYEELRMCLLTMEKYECNRLR